MNQEQKMQEIKKNIEILHPPDQNHVVEVRMFGVEYKSTISGYYDSDHIDKLAKDVLEYDGKAESIYITLNPVDPALLGRANNKLKEKAKAATSDNHIVKRTLLLIDIDPERPSGISSSDEEKKKAKVVVDKIYKDLKSKGLPKPIAADSGNGYHLLYDIDLENTPESTKLIERVLIAVDLMFSTEDVKTDLKVFNAARITKFYGTKARKGEDTKDRPHRYSKILYVPEKRNIVSKEKLEEIARLAPTPPQNEYQNNNYSNGQTIDIEQKLKQYGLAVYNQRPWRDGTLYKLTECPFDENHKNGDACLIQFASGAVTFSCFHNSCSGKNWHSLRDKFEPAWKERKQKKSIQNYEINEKRSNKKDFLSIIRNFSYPEKLSKDAYHGIAGRLVNAISSHTEADDISILISFLTAFGNSSGDLAYLRIGADKHPGRLFVVLAGESSKSRKGSSFGFVREIFNEIETDWTRNIASGLSSGEGLIYAVRDPIYKQKPIRDKESKRVTDYEDELVDDGVNDKRLLVQESELSSVLKTMGREGNILSPIIRECWDTGNLRTLTKNSPVKATGAHISIIGHVTIDELKKQLTEIETVNGFANRFLFFCVKRSKCLPFGGSFNVDNIRELIEDLKSAIEFARQDMVMEWDNETKPIWRQIYPELSEGKPGIVGSILARSEAYVCRLCCLYALLDKSKTIKPEHLKAAIAVWDYCADSVRYIFQDATGNRIANEILNLLNSKPEGVPKTGIYGHLDNNCSKAEVDDALKILKQQGLATHEEKTTGGRPAEIWFSSVKKYEKNEESINTLILNSFNS